MNIFNEEDLKEIWYCVKLKLVIPKDIRIKIYFNIQKQCSLNNSIVDYISIICNIKNRHIIKKCFPEINSMYFIICDLMKSVGRRKFLNFAINKIKSYDKTGRFL